MNNAKIHRTIEDPENPKAIPRNRNSFEGSMSNYTEELYLFKLKELA